MSASTPGRADVAFRMEAAIARLLIIGTYAAMALTLAGVVLTFASGTDPLAHGAIPTFDLGRIPGDLLALRPEGFLWAGVLTIVALPIGRVVVAGVGFLAARDMRLALVSLLVFLLAN
ncbi:MAG: DUF1634 domain-containing protein, partial [Chloroflexota bacterium]